MAYTYSDWDSQATLALRIARGKLFIAELTDLIGADVSSESESRRNDNRMELIKTVSARVAELESQYNGSAGMVNGGISFGHFGSARR